MRPARRTSTHCGFRSAPSRRERRVETWRENAVSSSFDPRPREESDTPGRRVDSCTLGMFRSAPSRRERPRGSGLRTAAKEFRSAPSRRERPRARGLNSVLGPFRSRPREESDAATSRSTSSLMTVSIRALAKRATSESCDQRTADVSIRALAKRATAFWRASRQLQVFRSAPSRRERLRSPAVRRPLRCFDPRPREESDHADNARLADAWSFDPRPREESDCALTADVDSPDQFRSAPSRRERPEWPTCGRRLRVSIRALAKRATSSSEQRIGSNCFDPRPREESDAGAGFSRSVLLFRSAPSRRERRGRQACDSAL